MSEAQPLKTPDRKFDITSVSSSMVMADIVFSSVPMVLVLVTFLATEFGTKLEVTLFNSCPLISLGGYALLVVLFVQGLGMYLLFKYTRLKQKNETKTFAVVEDLERTQVNITSLVVASIVLTLVAIVLYGIFLPSVFSPWIPGITCASKEQWFTFGYLMLSCAMACLNLSFLRNLNNVVRVYTDYKEKMKALRNPQYPHDTPAAAAEGAAAATEGTAAGIASHIDYATLHMPEDKALYNT